MSGLKRTPKLFVSLCAVLIMVAVWQMVRGANSETADIRAVAARLLPDSGQPLQFGALLSSEAVEIGHYATLTLVLRNNDPQAVEPAVLIHFPASLRLEAGQLDDAFLLNAGQRTIHWRPLVEARGGVIVQELRFLVWQPTGDDGAEWIDLRLSHDRQTQEIALPFWAGLSLAPHAVFQISDDTPGVGQQLLFSNASVGYPPLSYHWDFGDGHYSTAANPRHAFAAPGEYLVRLAVANHLGEAAQTARVVVGRPPEVRIILAENLYAGVPFVAQAFTDGGENSLVWDMGDGVQLTGFWIEHTYGAPGEYLVTLDVANPFGNSVVSQLARVQPGDLSLPTAAAATPSPTPDLMALDIQLAADPVIDALPLTNQLLEYINEARRQAGLSPVSWSYQLSQAAQLHANDAAYNFVPAHIGSDGSNPYDRVERMGYVEGYLLGEMTAWGFNGARAAVQFWLDSADHRFILLSPYAGQIGAGQTTNYDSRYVWYWVVEVASFEIPPLTVTYGGGAPAFTATPTTVATLTATPTTTATPLSTPTPTSTGAPTATATGTPTLTPTSTPTDEAVITVSPTITATTAPPPTASATPPPTGSPTPSPTATPAETAMPTPTITPTATPEATSTPTPTATPVHPNGGTLP